MKKLLIYSGLAAMMVAVWQTLPLLDSRDEEYENRLIGALNYLEGIIEASYPDTGSADLFQSPTIQPGADPGVWTVSGNVALRSRGGTVTHEVYDAVVRNVCISYRERRCWQLHRLAIGGQVYVEDGLNEHTSAAAAVRRGTSPINDGKRPSSEQATTVAAAEAESTADAASEPADEARGVPPTNGPAHRHSGAVDAAASAAPGSARPAEVNGIESERDLVLLIQQRLDDVGLDPGPHDGKVGSRTAAAIKSYQRTHGLVTDGKATAGLLEHLTQNLAGDTGSQDPATADRSPANRDKNIVLLVQQRLLQAGFDPGKPDGIMGWRSRDAIEAYQREHGLTVDGRATPELLDRLERQLQARGTGKNGSRRKPVQEATAPIATDIIDSSSEERVKNQQTAGFRIQLAAFRSGPDAAHRELERVRREYEDLLASLPLIVTHADGGDGAIYKVQAGPLDEDRANAVCDALKQRHQGCLVIKR